MSTATDQRTATAQLQQLEMQRVWFAATALIITLVVGLVDNRFATVLFVMALAVSVLLIRRAFPTMWLYSAWLAAVYALAFIGAIILAFSAAVASPLVGPVPVFAAFIIALEGASLYAGLSLFAEVKSIRDFRTRLSIARGDEVPEYQRIGLWTIGLILFFVISNVSAITFVGWVRGSSLLPVHAALEALLIGLALYLLYFAESSFGELPQEFRAAARADKQSNASLVGGLLGADPAGGRAPALCPACYGPLTEETRACPSCGASRLVGWCPKSEAHVVECQHCRRPVIYGKPVCPHCRGELKESLPCPSCKASAPLRDWKRAPKAA
jgi:hypothetical protein